MVTPAYLCLLNSVQWHYAEAVLLTIVELVHHFAAMPNAEWCLSYLHHVYWQW